MGPLFPIPADASNKERPRLHVCGCTCPRNSYAAYRVCDPQSVSIVDRHGVLFHQPLRLCCPPPGVGASGSAACLSDYAHCMDSCNKSDPGSDAFATTCAAIDAGVLH